MDLFFSLNPKSPKWCVLSHTLCTAGRNPKSEIGDTDSGIRRLCMHSRALKSVAINLGIPPLVQHAKRATFSTHSSTRGPSISDHSSLADGLGAQH